MSETRPESDEKSKQPSSKNGEESFTKEIKDYAKTTMNELLGMFGYDDEITSESVNNLEIKVPSTSEETSTVVTNSSVNAVPPVTVAMVTASSSGTPSIPVNVPDDSTEDVPVIVKVEGNTSVNDIIQQQNGGGVTTTATISTTSTNQASTGTPSVTNKTTNIAVTTQSETGQPALAPHFYAVPPAVRGLYCVVANLPLVVNQNKSAMTFKFWNCITCSEYFLHKPEVVFRVHYPHLFNGQPEWLYQAAVCLKCYHNLRTTVVPQTTTIPASLSQATFTVIDCTMEERDREKANNTTSVYTTASQEVVVSAAIEERKSPAISNGNPPSSDGEQEPGNPLDESKDDTDFNKDVPKIVTVPVCVTKGNPIMQAATNISAMNLAIGSPLLLVTKQGHSSPLNTPKDIPSTLAAVHVTQGIPSSEGITSSQGKLPPITSLKENWQGGYISIETLSGNPTPEGDSPVTTSPKTEQIQRETVSEESESMEENVAEKDESYKCYVCNVSVSVTSQHGKLRRSKFPSLFTNAPDNVGHFKVCQDCFGRLNHARNIYVMSNVPDEQRNYSTELKKTPDLCFICETILDDKEVPSRPIYRSRYPSLFRGLPGHVIHVPICDKCYKKLQKVKLRFDSTEHDEETRNYIQFVNMWRAKRGLGKHPVLV